MTVLVGTSGWQYSDWRGLFYPPGVPQRRWLEHYAGRYATVENNGSFYRLPKAETFADWRARTPDGFVMAVKASRYLTHVRRLQDPAEPVERLMRAAAGLQNRLGPVLLQLPPNLPADAAALDACLREFARYRVPPEASSAPSSPEGTGTGTATGTATGTGGRVRVAVEFRNDSWWTEETRQLLAHHQAALCWADRRGRPLNPLWRTADWGYLRFHEGPARPWPRYGRQSLRNWVQRLADTWPDEADVFVYFNNDPGGAAVHDADAFASVTRRACCRVTGAT